MLNHSVDSPFLLFLLSLRIWRAFSPRCLSLLALGALLAACGGGGGGGAAPGDTGDPPAPTPNLRVTQVELAAQPQEFFSPLTVTATVSYENITGTRDLVLRIYHSADASIDLMADALQAEFSPTHAAGEANYLLSYSPSSIGTVYIGVCAFETGASPAESDLSDNCAVSAMTRVICDAEDIYDGSACTEAPLTAGVDLAARDFAVTPERASAGDDITLQVTVANRGMEASQPATVTFYYSADTAIDTSDSVLAVEEVASVASGEQAIAMATTPVSFPTGSFLGACVTTVDTGAGMDTNAANNCALGPEFTLSDPNDLDGDGVPNAQDVDDDNDGLIEITTLPQLHNIRFNLGGRAYQTGPSAASASTMGAATSAELTNCFDGDPDTSVSLCGYELMNDLDFDSGDDDRTWTLDADGNAELDADDHHAGHFPVDADGMGGWQPIGDVGTPFFGIFDGNGHAIHNLAQRFSAPGAGQRVVGGLFAEVGGLLGQVRNLGLVRPLVEAEGPQAHLGTIAGRLTGSAEVLTTYVLEARLVYRLRNANQMSLRAGLLAGEGVGVDTQIIASYAAGVGDVVLPSLIGMPQSANAGLFTGGLHLSGLINGERAEGVRYRFDPVARRFTTETVAVAAVRVHGSHADFDVGYRYAAGTPDLQHSRTFSFPGDEPDVLPFLAVGLGHGAFAVETANSSSPPTTHASYATGEVDLRQIDAIPNNATFLHDYVAHVDSSDPVSRESHSFVTAQSSTVVSYVGSTSSLSSPSSLTASNAGDSWNATANLTFNLWDFGDATEAPAIRYADYDGPTQGQIRCAMFPVGRAACEAGAGALLPGQRGESLAPPSGLPQPVTDLSVGDFSAPARVFVTEFARLSATVFNAGESYPQVTTLTFYASGDSTIGPGDMALHSQVVPRAVAGSPAAFSVSVVIPTGLSENSFFGACIGPVAGDRATTDDCSQGQSVTVTTPRFDVALSDLSLNLAQADIFAADGARLRVTVRGFAEGNLLGREQDLQLTVYHSSDATLEVGSDRQQFTTTLAYRLGSTQTYDVAYAADSTGSLHVGACIGAVVSEADAANNCRILSAPTTVCEPLRRATSPGNCERLTQDLNLMMLSPMLPAQGEPFPRRVTLELVVGRTAEIALEREQQQFRVRVYHSSDGTLEVGTDDLQFTALLAQPDNPTTRRHSVDYVAQTTGSVHIATCLESISTGLAESNPANNCVIGTSAVTLCSFGGRFEGTAGTCAVPGADDLDGDQIVDAMDVDDDNDGLIEIATLQELHNMRHTLDGSGYRTAAGGTLNTMGAPTDEPRNCDDGNDDNDVNLCGYELADSLDFDVNDDGRTWSVTSTGALTLNAEDNHDDYFPVASGGWEPIGSEGEPFTGIFDGNGFAIRNLAMIRRQRDLGLFERIRGGQVRNLGLVRPLVATTRLLRNQQGRMGAVAATLSRGSNIFTTYVVDARIAFYWENNESRETFFGGLLVGNVDLHRSAPSRIVASYASGVGFVEVDQPQGTFSRPAFTFAGLANGVYSSENVAAVSVHGSHANLDLRFVDGGVAPMPGFDLIAAGLGVRLPQRNDSATGLRHVPTLGSYASGSVDFSPVNSFRELITVLYHANHRNPHSHSFMRTTGRVSGVFGSPSSVASSRALSVSNTDQDTWNSAANFTANLWDYGDGTQAPAIRYADYDGPGEAIRCAMFPVAVQQACEAGNGPLLPGQRDSVPIPTAGLIGSGLAGGVSGSSGAPSPGPFPQLRFTPGDSAGRVTGAVGLPDAAPDGAALVWSVERDDANLASLRHSTLAVRRPAPDAPAARVTLRADYADGGHRLIELSIPARTAHPQ